MSLTRHWLTLSTDTRPERCKVDQESAKFGKIRYLKFAVFSGQHHGFDDGHSLVPPSWNMIAGDLWEPLEPPETVFGLKISPDTPLNESYNTLAWRNLGLEASIKWESFYFHHEDWSFPT